MSVILSGLSTAASFLIVMDAPSVANRDSVKRLRCVIIEDHRMFLDLVTTMLHAAPGLGIDVVETAGTVAEGIAACDRVKPDVVLLDLALPDGTGITVAEHVASTQPDARIVVISGQSSTFVCPTKLSRCTHAVVHKAEAFDALQAILAGLSAPDRRAATGASGRPQTTNSSLVVRPLSQREREILVLVGASLTSDEIAAKLELSLHTVNTHRKNIAMKLGIPGRKLAAEAFRFRDQLARDASATPS